MKMSFFEPNRIWLKFYWTVLIVLVPVLVALLILDPIKEIVMLWFVAAGWAAIGVLICEYVIRKEKEK